MQSIKLLDKYFSSYISSEKLELATQKLAKLVAEKHKGETPLFISILNGSFMFAADFMKAYPYSCEISFLKLSSYNGTETTEEVKELIGINESLEGRSIIILEDIIDTGTTLQKVADIISEHNVKSLEVATLFFKPDVYRKELPVDYVGLKIPDEFIVGYGLDYNERGRNLNSIYKIINPKMKNIVLFGPPGAGKGTQADVLKDKYNLVHISTGDVFRFNIKNETELGLLAKSFIDEGKLVPDEVTINMLEAEVEKNPEANGFIFDGFPRTSDQAAALDAFLSKKGETINGMVALEVPEDLLVERLLKRGETSGRSDDQDESKIRSRFAEYNEKTAIVKDFYEKQNKYFGINGVGEISDITEKISEVVDQL